MCICNYNENETIDTSFTISGINNITTNDNGKENGNINCNFNSDSNVNINGSDNSNKVIIHFRVVTIRQYQFQLQWYYQ